MELYWSLPELKCASPLSVRDNFLNGPAHCSLMRWFHKPWGLTTVSVEHLNRERRLAGHFTSWKAQFSWCTLSASKLRYWVHPWELFLHRKRTEEKSLSLSISIFLDSLWHSSLQVGHFMDAMTAPEMKPNLMVIGLNDVHPVLDLFGCFDRRWDIPHGDVLNCGMEMNFLFLS